MVYQSNIAAIMTTVPCYLIQNPKYLNFLICLNQSSLNEDLFSTKSSHDFLLCCPSWVQSLFSLALCKLTESLTIKEIVISSNDHQQWDQITELLQPSNCLTCEWPKSVEKSTFQELLPTWMSGMILYNNSLVCLRVLDYDLLFRVELLSKYHTDSYHIFKLIHAPSVKLNVKFSLSSVELFGAIPRGCNNLIADDRFGRSNVIDAADETYLDIGHLVHVIHTRLLSLLDLDGINRTCSRESLPLSFLITGNSGAGKTTFLQSLRSIISKRKDNIILTYYLSLDRSSRRHQFEFNYDIESLSSLSAEILFDKFISIFSLSPNDFVDGAPTNESTVIRLLLVDNMDDIIMINQKSDLDDDSFGKTDGSNLDYTMVNAYAALILRELLTRLGASSYPICKLAVVGTTRIPVLKLPRHHAGCPQFEKVVLMPRPTHQERFAIVGSSLRSWARSNQIEFERIVSGNSSDSMEELEVLNDWISRITSMTRGYLPGDIKRLLDLAYQRYFCYKSNRQNVLLSNTAENVQLISWSVMLSALANCPPQILSVIPRNNTVNVAGNNFKLEGLSSILSAKSGEVPNVDNVSLDRRPLNWTRFGGYADKIDRLQHIISRVAGSHTIKSDSIPSHSERISFSSVPQGIVLYGPSGCGKSFLASIIAAEAHMSFVSVRCTELLSPYFGQTESLIRDLFSRARASSPCLLFFDDFDSIANSRGDGGSGSDTTTDVSSRVLSTFLNELDGVSNSPTSNPDDQILTMIACQDIKILDSALIRPGRLQHHFHLTYPSMADITAIFAVELNEMNPFLSPDVTPEILTKLYSNLKQKITPADIVGICRHAKLVALRQAVANFSSESDLPLLNMTHFSNALRSTT